LIGENTVEYQKMPVIIQTSAPTRVDLAGGTIDIPPLFLFHEGALTVNFAISLKAHCRIETRQDKIIRLESVDRGVAFEIGLDDLDTLKDEPRLELLSKLVYFFRPETGFTMTTRSEVPAGAGLAGSSTLNIACIVALNRLVGNRYPAAKFIGIAAAIECQVIKVPTGYQDYYSAQYGGIAAIHFAPDGMLREEIATDISELERRIAICYTGEPRNSGTNNWEITKAHIDGDREIFSIFDSIRDTAVTVREKMLSRDWAGLGEALKKAHPNRKRLSPNMTTPQMDLLIQTAMANGAIAAKVCGAGGGGCIAFFCEDGKRDDVEQSLRSMPGAEILDWNICNEGVTLEESK